MEFLTRTVIHVENILLQAGQPTGFKHEAKLIVLRKFEYRLKLNISMNSEFYMSCHIWHADRSTHSLGITIKVRTYFGPCGNSAHAPIGSLNHPKKHKITPKCQRLLQDRISI